MTTTLTGGRGWLNDDAAAAVHRADKALGRRLDINAAGRSRARQQELWDAYYVRGLRVYEGKTLGAPARPGTSPHEAGNAIDSDDQRWLNGHPGFGLHPNLRSEPWHYIYDPDRDVALAQTLLNELGRGLDVDGVRGPKTKAALKAVVGSESWGAASRKKLLAAVRAGKPASVTKPKPAPKPVVKPKPAAKPTSYPKVTVKNIASGLADPRGLQKIARLHGYTGKLDKIWGSGSQKGFKKFLKANGYKSPADWLRKRWGYVGDDRLGPVMKAAIKKANDANYKAL